MASAFLGKYASVTAVDLIQQKLNFRNFYESNLNSLPSNYGITSCFIPPGKRGVVSMQCMQGPMVKRILRSSACSVKHRSDSSI